MTQSGICKGRQLTRHIDQIRLRAKELARSGQYIDCFAIERQLADEGYEGAGSALQDPVVRKLLNKLCEKY
jgi:hypothetical protein